MHSDSPAFKIYILLNTLQKRPRQQINDYKANRVFFKKKIDKCQSSENVLTRFCFVFTTFFLNHHTPYHFEEKTLLDLI